MIPDEEAHFFEGKITKELQSFVGAYSLTYVVEKADVFFQKVIVFVPTEICLKHLQRANQWLTEKVKQLSGDCWGLNHETIPENFTSHMTLWRILRPDKRLSSLQGSIQEELSFHLTEAGFVLF